MEMAGPWITEFEKQTVADAMDHWYSDCYYYCEKFEKEFAEFTNRKYALMTPSCTTAIHLFLSSLNIGAGDKILVPECTWIATVAPTKYVNATPVFCDIDCDTWCIDYNSIIKNSIGFGWVGEDIRDIKGIIVVDLYGNMPNYDELVAFANQNKIWILEDAAEAFGSSYKGKPAGSFGLASVFSFHRTKTITTGEGGMLVTNDEELYERARFLRDHGRIGYPYYNTEVAFKYMPNNISAALGWAQLQRSEEIINKKKWILEMYRYYLLSSPLTLNPEPEEGVNGCWCVAAVLHNKNKEEIINKLQSKGLPARPFFYPLTSLPPFHDPTKRYENRIAYNISRRGINLPSALNITEEDIKEYCIALNELL